MCSAPVMGRKDALEGLEFQSRRGWESNWRDRCQTKEFAKTYKYMKGLGMNIWVNRFGLCNFNVPSR